MFDGIFRCVARHSRVTATILLLASGWATTGSAVAQTFTTQSWSSGVAPSIPISGQCLSGDFNGDGLMDIACYSGSGGSWALGLSSGSGLVTQTWSSGVSPGGPVSQQCITGDFNADGLTDIACLSASSSSTWSVALSSGTGFNSQSWGGGSTVTAPVTTNCVTGDFNGDGRTDMACYTGGGGSWTLWLASGSGFVTQLWLSNVAPSSAVNQLCMPGDFDGDGRTDIACYSGSGGSWNLAISTGSGFTTQIWNSTITPNTPIGAQCVAGDFNGDGRTDISCYTGSSGVWATGLSSGSGFVTQFWSSSVTPTNPVSQQCATGDFNGDGLTDIACYSGSGGAWSVGFTTGTGFVTQTWSSGVAPSIPIFNQCVTGDVNGDGLTDIACYASGGSWSVGMAAPAAM